MNKQTIFYLFAATLLFSACKNDNSAVLYSNVTVSYEATYGGEHLIKYHNYDYTGFPIQFNRLDLFVTDVTLFNSTQSFPLTPVAFLNFTPDNATNDSTVTIKSIAQNIPDGYYNGIKIGYGVKSDYNNLTPASFPLDNPLSNGNEYWASWKSYIFSKIEGQADTNNDKVFDTFLTYHCGSNAVYKSATINTPIQVKSGSAIKIAFDLKKVMVTSAGQPWNILADPVTSNNKDSVRVANILMSNFGNATTVSQ
jgi:hypothetical protein